MLRKFARLFVIKNEVEAYLIIYALAVGAMERGKTYLHVFPGWGGWLLFTACSGAVFMAGAKILDALRYERERRAAEAAAAEDARYAWPPEAD